MMNSWVYLYSQFTQEALLFQLLGICILTASYCAFWVLKKRRFGSVDQTVPAGIVRDHLHHLMSEARVLRTQLFGLLNEAGAPAPAGATAGVAAQVDPATLQAALTAIAAGGGAATVGAAVAGDPALTGKYSELEKKLADQMKAFETLLGEKSKIEQELAAARAAGGGAGATSGDSADLMKKIKDLEGRLAEYSIIEDDLANLKRLQQENAKLKSMLGEAAPTSGATAAAEPAVAAPAPAPADEVPPPPVDTATEAVSSAADAAADAVSAEAPVEAPTDNPAFEGLVDQVEQSLASAAPAASAPEPAAAPSTTGAPSGETGEKKKDDDLLAEFEKILNM